MSTAVALFHASVYKFDILIKQSVCCITNKTNSAVYVSDYTSQAVAWHLPTNSTELQHAMLLQL